MGSNYPIILAHGICRFDEVLHLGPDLDNQPDDSAHYFKSIRSVLMQEGFEVYHTRVAWAAGVERRCDQLKEQIERCTASFSQHQKVHIIAHSMGGLDARHMLYKYRMEERVASLNTIGTPHKGSSFADWGVKRFGWFIPLLDRIGFDLRGFFDLTRERCRAFNEEAAAYEKGNGVKYRTYAGVQPRERIFLPLKFSYEVIRKEEGPNDGLVSLQSASWKDDVFVKSIDADHLNEIGWCDFHEPEFFNNRDEFERRIQQFYLELARGL